MKLGIIGVGNMGAAILRGICKQKLLPAGDVYIYDPNAMVIKALQQELGVLTAQSANAMIAACDIVLLAVKPNVCGSLVTECAPALEDKALISIVLGWNRQKLSALAPKARILRVMPNTPCLCGEGMVALDLDHTLSMEELAFAQKLFSAIGKVTKVPSYLMAAVTGISGSGPAYVYMFIEAMADAGVRAGLPRDLAYQLSSQTVLGSARMVQETGNHPGELKDAVCSPAGSTIEAVSALEHAGFRAAVLDAVKSCVDKVLEVEKSQ